jgi:hypothetical protein
VAFDVNETLSDMAPMAARFTEIGAPAHLARLWFTCLLRDGFALTAAGAQESFALLGEQALRFVLAEVPLNRDLDGAIDYVMNGFSSLPTHPDVPGGVRALLLVAVHPWDIDGAARAGMVTAWINRTGAPYPTYFTEPRYRISTLDQLAERLPG